MGLLETTDDQESRLFEPGNTNGTGFRDAWPAAVPGLVGGFMARGACARRACGLIDGNRVGGGGLGESDEPVVIGGGGSGLLGGRDGLATGLGGSRLTGAGILGRSLLGGTGGNSMMGPICSEKLDIQLFLWVWVESHVVDDNDRKTPTH